MARYDNNETKKLLDGRVVYRSKIYPTIPLRDDDMYFIAQEGDRCDNLAQRFYGDKEVVSDTASINFEKRHRLLCWWWLLGPAGGLAPSMSQN